MCKLSKFKPLVDMSTMIIGLFFMIDTASKSDSDRSSIFALLVILGIYNFYGHNSTYKLHKMYRGKK